MRLASVDVQLILRLDSTRSPGVKKYVPLYCFLRSRETVDNTLTITAYIDCTESSGPVRSDNKQSGRTIRHLINVL